MTCYLTSRDGRFAAAVAAAASATCAAWQERRDEGHGLSDHEWGFKSPAGRDFTPSDPITPGRPTCARPRCCCTATPTSGARSGRPSNGTPRCASSASTRNSSGIRAGHICSFSTASRHIESTTTSGWWTGWSSTQARPSGRRSTGPTGSGAWRCSPRGTRSQARPSASCVSALFLISKAGGRPDELVEAAYGYANFPAKIEATTDTLFQIGSMSKVWTATLAMQLVDEGKLDLDAPRRRGPAGTAARGRRGRQDRHDAAPAQPHQRHRRRRVHRHRPRRRLRGEVRRPAGRAEAEPPAWRPRGRTATPASCSPGGSSRSSPG